MSQILNLARVSAQLEKQANIKAITQAGKALAGQAGKALGAQVPKAMPKAMPKPPRAARGDNLPSWVKQNLSRQHGIRSYNQLRDSLPAMQTTSQMSAKGKPQQVQNAELSKLLKILGDFGWGK